ncbi:MAG: UDP-N-acetylglucosamine 1-carboxyvinyltransferase [Firmicutes bacterium HGW-Firmicutes-15]|nr:MAG: UDP-N-acetylglucosamine 1-carboxyvinyltransferase [Firmicutes bacterium HGW-Firmicutes-15]
MIISGKATLIGEVEVSSSKNAILPILAASLLTDEKVEVSKVPIIKDVIIISKLIEELGVRVELNKNCLSFQGKLISTQPPYELVRQIRASFLVMGPILARKGKVRVALPGGCAIGTRPIDLHLKGFQALGADISLNSGDVVAKASQLIGAHIYLDYPSVGATENIIMAASMASGTSYIENAALEPEIVDLANFINSMGGKVTGAGTNVIKIKGVKDLHGVSYTPIPDRIEAGTYMVAVAATGGDAIIKNIVPEHLKAITAKLIESGAEITEGKDYLRVKRESRIKPVYIKTLPYPGFPTDMQAQFMSYLSLSLGTSVISESVFENRFMHVQELSRMGADIKIEGKTAIIRGVKKLTGANIKATDLRAGAALVIAGLTAQGETVLLNSEHVDRGYENIAPKLNAMGASIKVI